MRIVTRGDMDGLTGSVIVSRNEQVDDIELIHPQDITAGRAEIRNDDVLINVPYHPDCGLWFDHHAHTATYPKPPREFNGLYRIAPSATASWFMPSFPQPMLRSVSTGDHAANL